MPTPCYINIEGQTPGPHQTAGASTRDSVGNIYVEGHEDEILVAKQFATSLPYLPDLPIPANPSGSRVQQTVQVHTRP